MCDDAAVGCVAKIVLFKVDTLQALITAINELLAHYIPAWMTLGWASQSRDQTQAGSQRIIVQKKTFGPTPHISR